jgi:prophage antirepressor-like protein
MTTTSTSALTFNGVELSTINHNNQIWMTSAELAKALGYSRADMISKIYDRNKSEFSEKMSKLIDPQNGVLGESSGLQHKARIFSLRGCHLIAMFAKTQIAKKFRVWVLDILDKEVGKPQTKYGLFDQLEQIEIPAFPKRAIEPCHPTMMLPKYENHVDFMAYDYADKNNVTRNKVVTDLAAHFGAKNYKMIPLTFYYDVCAYFNQEPKYKIPKGLKKWIMVEESSLELASRIDLTVKLDTLQKTLEQVDWEKARAKNSSVEDAVLTLSSAVANLRVELAA